MQELITVNVAIADRTYRIKINNTDEEQVRKTLKLINDKVIEFKTQFAGKDMQDYISMVVLWYATQAQSGNDAILEKEMADVFNRMEEQIDKVIAG